MSDYIIKVENLGKKYSIQHQGERERYVALRDVIARKAAAPLRWIAEQRAKRQAQSASLNGNGSSPLPLSALNSRPDSSPLSLNALDSGPGPSPLPLSALPKEEEFWALRGVNFEVKQGEVVGIIGRNGAGKSTLLKILSRITEPTEGRVRLRGRVASLLEVGTGFHPELTGRENIFVNGAILGMTRVEIARKFDEIVAFAEVEKFLDIPVKRYSSGMYVRLAFAVAAQLEPEILLVDEVLAVGDAGFQKKCLGKMSEVAKTGRTVLFVSHNMDAVRTLCSRGVWVDNGVSQFDGDTFLAIKQYLGGLMSQETCVEFNSQGSAWDSEALITRATLEPEGKILTNGDELRLTFVVKFLRECDCNLTLCVYREESLAFSSADFHRPVSVKAFKAAEMMEFIFRIPQYLLNPGHHSFGFFLADRGGNNRQIASVQYVLPVMIEDDQFRRGGQYLRGWGGAVSPIIPVTARKL